LVQTTLFDASDSLLELEKELDELDELEVSFELDPVLVLVPCSYLKTISLSFSSVIIASTSCLARISSISVIFSLLLLFSFSSYHREHFPSASHLPPHCRASGSLLSLSLSVCFYLVTIAVGRHTKSTILAYVDFVLAFILQFFRLIEGQKKAIRLLLAETSRRLPAAVPLPCHSPIVGSPSWKKSSL
jgi:hypothetical protein